MYNLTRDFSLEAYNCVRFYFKRKTTKTRRAEILDLWIYNKINSKGNSNGKIERVEEGVTKFYSLSGGIKTTITRRNRNIKKAALVVIAVVLFIAGGEIASFFRGNMSVHKPWCKCERRRVGMGAFHRVVLGDQAVPELLGDPLVRDHREVPGGKRAQSSKFKPMRCIYTQWGVSKEGLFQDQQRSMRAKREQASVK